MTPLERTPAEETEYALRYTLGNECTRKGLNILAKMLDDKDAELVRLRMDAARLDWLEGQWVVTGGTPEDAGGGFYWCADMGSATHTPLREAIDAATVTALMGSVCASCGKLYREHNPPHEWDTERRPSCPPPSLTGTFRSKGE